MAGCDSVALYESLPPSPWKASQLGLSTAVFHWKSTSACMFVVCALAPPSSDQPITCSLSETLADLVFWNLVIQQLAMPLNVKEHYDVHIMNFIVDKCTLQKR